MANMQRTLRNGHFKSRSLRQSVSQPASHVTCCSVYLHTDTVPTSVSHLTFIRPCIVTYFYIRTNEMHQFFKFILFCSSTLHVSDGLSVHHQESKTVHTASGICHTHTADCLLAGTRWNISFPLASSLRLLMMDGKTVRNM